MELLTLYLLGGFTNGALVWLLLGLLGDKEDRFLIVPFAAAFWVFAIPLAVAVIQVAYMFGRWTPQEVVTTLHKATGGKG